MKLIPFNELISNTQFTKTDGVRSLAELSSRAVHVKRKLKSLYQSLNTGGTSLPFNVMEVAMIIDKLMEQIGTKTSEESDADGYYTIELTLLSDKGVKWLNEINSIVKETRMMTRGIVEENEIDDMLEDLMKHLDESEILYED